jgi:putative glutamine amidotransferase
MTNVTLPIVGIICDKEIIGPHAFHIAGDKYIQAITNGSNCLPILISALGEPTHYEQLLDILDGILLTGGYSMIDPLNYQAMAAEKGTKLDTARDATSLPLVRKAIDKGIPLLGICRGFQEINVALGGSLHQKLHKDSRYFEHREDNNQSLVEQYSASHKVNLTQAGKLTAIIDKESIEVNSLHTQGVDQLAKGLTVEAYAEDGLVEAFSVDKADTFAIAVQWHPEWQFKDNENSVKLFNAFGQACLSRKLMRDING